MGQMVVVPRQARRTQKEYIRPSSSNWTRAFCVVRVGKCTVNRDIAQARKGNDMDSDEDDNDPREGA